MFKWAGKITTKFPLAIIVIAIFGMCFGGYIGGGVTKQLSSGGFDDKNSPSSHAASRLSNDFKQKAANVTLLVTASHDTVDSPAVTAAAMNVEKQLRQYPNLQNVFSYWTSSKAPSLRSRDNKQALIVGTLAGSESQVVDRIGALTNAFTMSNDTIRVSVGGTAEVNNALSTQVEKDLRFAELIALPVTLFILLIIFRSCVAALLPLVIGGFAILGTLLVLFILTKFTTVSIYALNLTTMLGLGLAIDYSLFIVSRFREELTKDKTVRSAVIHTINSAGRTVTFSALTVAASLSVLSVFPQPFLRSFAFAGVAVALIAAVGSITLLPAILMLLGKKINALPIGRKIVVYKEGSPFWRHLAHFVMDRPIPVALGAIVLLLVLGIPFRSIHLGGSDERSLPASAPVRAVHQQLRSNFDSQQSATVQVVSRGTANVTTATVASYAAKLSRIPSVKYVTASAGTYTNGFPLPHTDNPTQLVPGVGTWLSVSMNADPTSVAGETIVSAVRSTAAPFEVYVGGVTATNVDLRQSIVDHLPLAIGLVCIITSFLLFMLFGSVLVPIKALIISALSLSADFGAMVWIFQDGHLSNLLRFTATGTINATMPMLMFCVAFGLSMDYEVFLLSRIKERYNKTGDNRDAVAHGLAKTGGIVTAAAITISTVFLAFATSGVSIIKMFGLILAFAVVLDAFVIRSTLVPAFMRLAGKANWWAPKPLKWLHRRYGIAEVDS